jgi:hypothetical protein
MKHLDGSHCVSKPVDVQSYRNRVTVPYRIYYVAMLARGDSRPSSPTNAHRISIEYKGAGMVSIRVVMVVWKPATPASTVHINTSISIAYSALSHLCLR